MSKRTNQSTWQPEIDQSYERQVGRLGAIEGSVNDYVSKPTREAAAIAPVQPKAWVPEVRPQQTPVVVRRMEPVEINMPQQAIMQVDHRTNGQDRAKGFVIETDRLALFGGVLAVLISWVGYGNPLLALPTLLTFGIWFCVVYFVMWLIHRVLTPEFVALLNALVGAFLAIRGR